MTGAAPPRSPAVRGRLRAARGPLVIGAGAAVAALALVLMDPNEPGSWGACPVYALTGRYCAGCGVLRATHDLLVGDLAGAWSMNPLWVVVVPVVVFGWIRWLVRALRTGGRGSLPPASVALVSAAVIVVYSLARNVPAWAGVLAP